MPGGRPRAKTQTDSVKSVAKVLDILEHLGSSQGAVSVSDLARATGLNVSTAYRLLQTLMARGYVEQERSNRGYFSQGEIVQLCKADGKQAVSAAIRSMVREPAYCTATGKVLLSALSAPEFDKYVQGVALQDFTPQTVTSKAELRREIGKVRETGFALDLEEFVPNLCCVAIPVRDHNGGAPLAAISIAMPKMRFKKAFVPRWCEQMRQKAVLITQQLGLVEN